MKIDLQYDSENSVFIYRECEIEVNHSIGYSEFGAYAHSEYIVRSHLSDNGIYYCESFSSTINLIDELNKTNVAS